MLRGVTGSHEHRIGRNRPFHLHSFGLGLGHGGGNHLDFLAPKQATFARMRVQPCHRDAGRTAQAAGQCRMGDAQGLQDVGLGHGVQRRAQRHMDADQHGAQLVVGQHHAHRHLGNGHAGVVRSFGLQQLGVTRKIHACQRQRLFVQRRRHQRGHLPCQRSARRPLHAACGGFTGRPADLTPGGGCRHIGQLQHRNAARRNRPHIRRGGNGGHRQVGFTPTQHRLGTAAQGFHIAGDKAPAHEARMIPKGLGDDFRPDTRRIPLGDGDGQVGWGC